MQEEKVNGVHINIESVVLFLRDQLSSAEASIRYAQLELDALIQNIHIPYTQNDIPVCKCSENPYAEVIYTYGEKIDKDYQSLADRVKIAEDFWKSFKSEE
jgi:hypothetical protein